MRENKPWYFNSACSRHMIGVREQFLTLTYFQGKSVAFGNGKTCKIVGIG